MNRLIYNVKAWESAPWRPNGRHEDAYLPQEIDSPRPVSTIYPREGIVAGRVLNGEDTLLDALGTLTPGQDAYGSYVDNFGGFPELLTMKSRLNPAAVYFAYTIFGNPAHFADVEPGAMHPASFGAWLRDGRGWILPGNKVPGAYTSAGNADALFSAAGLGGLPHDQLPDSFIYQSAHYGAGEHICHPRVCGFRAAHGTQWDDKGPAGQNFDRALWLPGVLSPTTTPPLPPPPEGADPNMISIAMSSDGDIIALCETQPSGPDKTGEVFALRTTAAWNGTDGVPWKGVQGKTSHLWESLGTPKP